MAETTILPAKWDVPQSLRARLSKQVGRQREIVDAGHLLLVLHAVPRLGDRERRGQFFWRSPDGNWSSNELGSGVGALSKHIDTFENAIVKLDRQAEQASSVDELFDVLGRLAPVRRTASHLYQVLYQVRQSFPEYTELINARDRAYGVERQADLLQQATKNELDLAVAKRAEEQAASGHRMAVAAFRLNMLVAFFFPVATLTAVFGANLRHGLEEIAAPWPFLVLIGIGLLLGLVLTLVVTKRPPPSRQ